MKSLRVIPTIEGKIFFGFFFLCGIVLIISSAISVYNNNLSINENNIRNLEVNLCIIAISLLLCLYSLILILSFVDLTATEVRYHRLIFTKKFLLSEIVLIGGAVRTYKGISSLTIQTNRRKMSISGNAYGKNIYVIEKYICDHTKCVKSFRRQLKN